MKTANKKYLIKIVALALAVIMPLCAMLITAAAIPSQFSHTFLGALKPKFERLCSIDEPKIVVVGGSSVAFGLRSDLLSEQLGMPVVNFGLYATLGTKVMLDLSKANINKGDIIVVAPELDKQTLSLYFNAESMWQALDSDISMLPYVGSSDRGKMAAGFIDYLESKIKYSHMTPLDPAGVYNSASFNEYGDIVYERPCNVMTIDYDPNMIITLDSSIFDSEFIDYLNEYTAYAEKKGATVYFSFPPMNELALSPDTTDEQIHEFYDFICRSLDCEVISDINSYVIDYNYFYDSNFHLNDSGVILRTYLLAEDIIRAEGKTTAVTLEVPPAPEKIVDPSVSGGDSAGAEYYKYESYGSGLMIVGVSDDAKGRRTLTIPGSSDGKTVLAIGKNAFDGCQNLMEITVGTNVKQFYDGAFAGAPALTKIHMLYESAENIQVGDGLFEGASEKCTLYFNQTGYEQFVSDYFWSKYALRMALEK